jgi:hypothetical protein
MIDVAGAGEEMTRTTGRELSIPIAIVILIAIDSRDCDFFVQEDVLDRVE